MKLQIKMLNQKSLVVDIEESKTVYDLKKELSLYPDVGVKPELQKLIYAGKILENQQQISAYNIDVKKFLVVMILKQPIPAYVESPSKSEATPATPEAPSAATATAASPSVKPAQKSTPIKEPEFKTPTTPADAIAAQTDATVAQIVAMGYAEADVRRALHAGFNNAERAIEYLIEGIPTSPSTPEGESFIDSDADLSMTPFEMFRSDPVFRQLRSAMQQNPDLINSAIERVGEANPALLELIGEHQQEFISMLIDPSDEDDDDQDDDDDDDA